MNAENKYKQLILQKWEPLLDYSSAVTPVITDAKIRVETALMLELTERSMLDSAIYPMDDEARNILPKIRREFPLKDYNGRKKDLMAVLQPKWKIEISDEIYENIILDLLK